MAGRHAYALLAFPVGLAGLVAALMGGAGPLHRFHCAMARRFLAVPASPTSPSQGMGRRLFVHCLTGLPANLVAFALVAPAWAVFITRGVFYPVFGADNLEQSWGGPSLAGAWLAHFIQGPPLLLVVSIVLWPVSVFQGRQARRYLG